MFVARSGSAVRAQLAYNRELYRKVSHDLIPKVLSRSALQFQIAGIRHSLLAQLLPVFLKLREHELSPEKRTQIEAAVKQFMASTHVPGLSLAVVENGEYEWGSGFGLADAENNAPGQRTYAFPPRFHLQIADGHCRDATVGAATARSRRTRAELLPVISAEASPITTRQVMGHLAGIRHYKGSSQDDPEVGNTKHFDNPIQAGLDFFKNDPLVSDPGKQFHYSTQGYTLVGCVIEGASGAKYVDFVRQNIFAPAGHGTHPNRQSFCHHPVSHPLLSEDGIRDGAECRLPRLQLQDSGRRMVVFGRRHGAV